MLNQKHIWPPDIKNPTPMLSKWFKKNSGVSLKEFLTDIKNGKRDFFETLKVDESHFNDAPFDELMSNTDDVIVGVNRVQKNFNKRFFDVFDNCLIKHHDNGDVKFVFYTVTNEPKKVIDFATVMISELGTGIFDNRRFTPFTNHQKIKDLSQGIYLQDSDEVVHSWFHDNVSFVLQYRIYSLRQFSLIVTIDAPKQHDSSIRRKGTILDLLNFNLDDLLNTEPLTQREELSGGKIKFVDYTYGLDKKEFDVFDTVSIRIFDSAKVFNKDIQTHIKLYSSMAINSDKKIAVVEQLVKVYGKDIYSSDDLEFHERDLLESGTYWTGRTWRFNEQHAVITTETQNEKMAFEVSVDDSEDEEGFKVSIFCFHELVSLFGPA